MLKEFRSFVLRGNVVDLAVGVVIGAAFGAIVTAMVDAFFDPLTALFGSSALDDLRFTVGTRVVDGEVVPNDFRYGLVLAAMLRFLVVAASVFFLVVKPVNHLMSRFRSEQPPGEPLRECPECTTRIPARATRCSACTAEIGAAAA